MNWLKSVQDATTTSDLLTVINDFILDKPQDHWDWIPKMSHPRLLSSVQDLHAWHHMVATDLGKTDAPNIRLQDLAVVLLRASARAYEIELEERRAAPHETPVAGREAKGQLQ